jgi:hypothetical protein
MATKAPPTKITKSGTPDDTMGTITWPLKQKAAYWRYSDVQDDQYARSKYDDPIEIKCRWSDEQEEVILPDGTKYVCKTKLMTDRNLVLRSFVKFIPNDKTLDDVAIPGKSPQELRAFEICATLVTPNTRCTKALREAYV